MLSQITAAKLFAPSLEFINSSTHLDCSGRLEFSFDIKPDVCVYTNTSMRQGPMDITHAELLIEYKWHSADDPFCKPTTDKNDQQTFLHNSKASTDTIGQITLYATAQLGSQFHVCIYSILIVKDYM